MTVALGRRGWRHALFTVLGAQLLFWSFYALVVVGFHPAVASSGHRLPVGGAGPAATEAEVGAWAPGLSGPAVLRVPGWQPAVLHPAQATLLAPSELQVEGGAWSLTCLRLPCGATDAVYAGPYDPISKAAGSERFQRFDMVWLAIAVQGLLGLALLVLLPISRFSRLQTITGLFMILVSADAWLTAFGAETLPHAWFPLLRYGVEYLMLTAVALTVNAFAGWRPRAARIAVACFAVALAVLIATMAAGGELAPVISLLDAAALALLTVYGIAILLRMRSTAPGPAIRVMTILLLGITSTVWDLLIHPEFNGPTLQASVLAPTVTTFLVLFELALQGRQLNREADEARTDLERQVLEQDASLLRSSSLLRHQERRIAIDAERQSLLRDMHDGVGGVLTHLLLHAREGRLTHAEIAEALQSAVDDLRNMASAIDAADEPIDEALAMFSERVKIRLARSGVAFDWRSQLASPAPHLDARRLLSLYRLLQEGIANTLRHGQATRIALTVEPAAGDRLLVTLSDDGVGFDPGDAKGSPGEGRGLANMHRRATQMGGDLRIESAPRQGVRLVLHLPIDDAGRKKY
ncbi:MAG: ATP-binding protein [Pseudomonadota bacterium]